MLVNLAKELQAVGFSEKQAKVYVACLELGPSSVQKIAVLAGLLRPTTYVILGELKIKGLVNEVVIKKKTMFSVVDPENIYGLLKKEQIELDKKISNFQKLLTEIRHQHHSSQNYPIVKIYEGYDGFEKLRQEFRYSKSKKIDEIVPLDLSHNFFPPAPEDHRKDIEKGPPIRTLYSSKKQILKSTKKVQSSKIIKDNGFTTEMVIGDDGIYFFDLGEKIIGFSIRHAGVSAVLRQLFELAWKKPSRP